MSDATLPPTEGTPVQPMRWPPPGLARIQGDLWVVARKMAIVASVLVVPLLIVLSVPHSPYGLGPLGEAWWLTVTGGQPEPTESGHKKKKRVKKFLYIWKHCAFPSHGACGNGACQDEGEGHLP